MLEKLRSHVKGWLGIVILIMISIPFALFGLQNYASDASEKPVAEVGDFKIYQSDISRAYQNRMAQLKEQYGDQYSVDLFNEEAIRKESLNRLVQDQLILHTVRSDGYVASNESILDVISKLDAFQKNGQFDKETYEQLLQARGMSTISFVDSVRTGIEKDQFINSITQTTLIDNSEIEDFYRLNNQTRDIRYLLIPIASTVNTVDATEDEIKKNYAQNEHLYKTEEEASIEYVELSLSDLVAQVEPTEAELLAFYKSEQQSFTALGQRRASHILFEAPEGTLEEESESKRAMAESVLARLKNGEEFSALAKEFSDDIGSAKEGGDLGLITEGMLGSEFENVLSSLQEGEFSEVKQTPFGFQIIKLTKKEDDSVKTYEQVKTKVAELFKNQVASENFYQQAERFAELGFENPDSLDPLVDELGLSIKQQTGVTSKTIDGIAAEDKVRHAVFNEDVLAGNNSEVVELAPEHLVILRIKEHQVEQLMPLDDVRGAVELSVKTNKAVVILNDKATELLASAKDNASIKGLAVANGATIEDVGPVTRNSKTAPAELLRDAFSMARPVGDKPTFKKSVLNTGDVVIIELNKITDGDKDDITDESRASFEKFLARLKGEVTLAAALANLSVSVDVVLNTQAE